LPYRPETAGEERSSHHCVGAASVVSVGPMGDTLSAATPADRPFGIWTASSLVVGLMIGVGIYGLPAQLAPFGWTSLAGWAVAAMGTLACVLALNGLVLARPGEHSLMAMCGAVLGEGVGVAIAWSYWVSLWCGNAVMATVIAQYGSSMVRGFQPPPLSIGVIGSAVLLVNSAVNLLGAREAGRMQVLLTGLKLIPLAAVVVMLAQLALTPGRHFAGLPLAPLHVEGIGPAVTLAFFSLLGFECAGMAAERVHDPARNVVRATLLGMAATTLVYVTACTGLVMALPRGVLEQAPAPFALLAGQVWGHWAALSVAVFAAISGLGAMNAQTLLLGEVPLGLVRAGQLPGWVAPVNRFGVAGLPLVLGNGLAIALLLGSATELGAALLAFLLKLTTVVSIFLYLGTCAATWRIGRARGWAALAILFCLAVIYGAGWEAGGLGLLLTLAGLPLYALARRIGSAQSSVP